MITIAAMALGLTVGGSDFAEAFGRARVYSHVPKVRRYLDTVFLPAIQKDMGRIVGDCARKLDSHGDVEFTIVISYENSKPDKVLLQDDTPFGRCAADGFANLSYPLDPPVPRLAEDLEMQIHLTVGPSSGATASHD